MKAHFNLAAPALVFALFLYTAGTAHAQSMPACGVTNWLGTLGGATSVAYGVNSVGEVVGAADVAPGITHAFLWTVSGGMTDLGTLPGGSSSYAYAINDNGIIVGASYTADGEEHAFESSGGGLTDLGTLGNDGSGGDDSVAYAINDNDVIVGYAEDASDNIHAVAWGISGGEATDLGFLPEGSYSAAYGVNDLGQIVGEADDSLGDTHAFLVAGAGEPLTDLAVSQVPDYSFMNLAEYSSASGISNSGDVVGTAGTYNGYASLQAFFWIASLPQRIAGEAYPVTGTSATGTNNVSQVIASGQAAPTVDQAPVRVVSAGADASEDASTVGAIGDSGVIVGSALNGSAIEAFALNACTGDGDTASESDVTYAEYPPIVGDDGALYGIAGEGANNNGVLYRVDPAGTYTVLHNFNVVDGSPWGSIAEGPNGNIFGTTISDYGNVESGVAYECDANGNYTIVNDNVPASSIGLYASGGLFYGYEGSPLGCAFSVDPNGSLSQFQLAGGLNSMYFVGSPGTLYTSVALPDNNGGAVISLSNDLYSEVATSSDGLYGVDGFANGTMFGGTTLPPPQGQLYPLYVEFTLTTGGELTVLNVSVK